VILDLQAQLADRASRDDLVLLEALVYKEGQGALVLWGLLAGLDLLAIQVKMQPIYFNN